MLLSVRNKREQHYREREGKSLKVCNLCTLVVYKKKKDCFIFPEYFKTTTSDLSHQQLISEFCL
jgi:hypothetical protein